MPFDDVFDVIGGLGAFQVVTFLLTGLPSFYSGYQTIAMTFLAPPQEHWCRIDRLENYSYAEQKYVAIPYDEESDSYYSCQYYDLPYDNLTDEEIAAINWTLQQPPEPRECDEWVFSLEDFVSTAVSDYELVCSRSSLVQWAYSANLLALILTAPIGGYLSDRYGRKRILVLSSFAQCVFVTAAAFSPVYWGFYLLRFLSGIFIFFGSACGYVLSAEIFGPKYRPVMGSVYWMFSACGFMVLPAMAYYIRDYVSLQIALAVPMLVSLCYVFVLKESPRWLLSRGRVQEAREVLQYIASVNGKEFDSTESDILKSTILDDAKPIKVAESAGVTDLFRIGVIRAELLLVIPSWLASNLMYYGLSFNTASLPGGVYINTFLAGFVEIPANFVALLSMYKLGRKPTLIWALLAAAGFSFACVPLAAAENEAYATSITALALCGKACITVAYTTVFMYTTEMFPTPVRHLAMSVANTVGNIAGIFAAFTGPPLLEVWVALPSLLFGTLGGLAAPLVLLLPETLNRALPDTLEEVRHLTLRDVRHAKPVTRHGQPGSSHKTPDQTSNAFDNLTYDDHDAGMPGNDAVNVNPHIEIDCVKKGRETSPASFGERAVQFETLGKSNLDNTHF